MQSSDPTFQRLFELWTPRTADQTWRVRFKDGTITVFTKMLAHEDEAGMRHGLGTVVREMREAAPDRWQVNDETYFELSEVKDVTHLESGDVVFPPSIARKRPAFVPQMFQSNGSGSNYATKGQAAGGAMVFMGLLMLAFGVYDAIKWTARKGLASAVVESLETREVWESSGRSSTKHFKGYAPDVVYRFSVGGTRYVGSIIEDDPDPAPTESQALRNFPYRMGDTITAHYNPKNPSDSVVMRESVPPLWFFLVLAPLFLFGGVVAWRSEALA